MPKVIVAMPGKYDKKWKKALIINGLRADGFKTGPRQVLDFKGHFAKRSFEKPWPQYGDSECSHTPY